MNDTVIMTKEDGVAVLTLNRPDKLNALNSELLEALESCMQDIQADAATRVVVITGSGAKAFAAGADISELHQQDG